MSLLFIDGFDHYTTPTQKWSAVSGTTYVTIVSGSRRGSGGGYLDINGSSAITTSEWASKVITPSPSNTVIIGAAVYINTVWGSTNTRANLFSVASAGGTSQCTVAINRTGTLTILRGSVSGTSIYDGGVGVNFNTWFYIECKFVIGTATSGSCEIRINGSPVSYVNLTGVNTQAAADSSIGSILVGPNRNASARISYDDLYVCDTSGSTQNTFLGDIRIDTVFPAGDGTYTQGVPSTGTSHYQLIDEAPPSTTDYVTLTGVGTKDSYSVQSLPSLSSQVIHGIQVNSHAAKDSGTTTAAAFVKSGSTELESTAFAVPAAAGYNSAVFVTDPNTSSSWTQSSFNAAEIGLLIKS